MPVRRPGLSQKRNFASCCLKLERKTVLWTLQGCCFTISGPFFQILEGKDENVALLFSRIERDPRHDRVLLLSKTEEGEGSFGDWSMGFIDIDQNASDLPGFIQLLEAKASFLDLRGESQLLAKLIDGFQEGKWRQGIGH